MDELEYAAKYLLKYISYAKLQELFTAVRTVKPFESTAKCRLLHYWSGNIQITSKHI